MGVAERPFVRRLLEGAQERTGLSLQRTSEVKRLRVVEREFGEFAQDAEELALHSLDYFGGRPQEMQLERRRRLAQRSRVALLQDPLAGAEAELLSNFGFGKGVSKPTARDPKVQDIIDQAWTDPINEQLLTGYMAQRKLSNELLCAGELFVTLYTNGGKIRVGKLDADVVVNVVPDPENRNIPLWYVARQREFKWDFATDSPSFADLTVGNQLKVKYWPHWRNVADAVEDRQRWGVEDDEATLEQPPADKLAKGLVYHVAVNQTGEQMRGNPPWARSLRFMAAMNVLTEAHVAMSQASSSFIARRTLQSSPRQLSKAAASVLAGASELGSSAFRPATGWGTAGNAEPPTQPFAAPGTPGPFPPASWWTENQASKLEALNLKSNAGEMAQSAQIVRAPIAASSGFGQHYLGDTSDTNLATASTLELPATMRVGAWQEFFEQMYRWFTDRAIETAVKAGALGGRSMITPEGARPLSEMRLAEAEDRAEMESRTQTDLSYEFTMPFPGRRQLADVTTFVQTICASMDPNGVNVPLRRIVLRFAFEQIGIDDVSRAVEESIPEKGIPGGIGPQEATGNAPGQFSAPPAGGAGAQKGRTGAGAGAGAAEPGEGQQPYGAKSGTAAGGGSAGDGGALEQDAEALNAAARELFGQLVMNPAVREAYALNGHSE